MEARVAEHVGRTYSHHSCSISTITLPHHSTSRAAYDCKVAHWDIGQLGIDVSASPPCYFHPTSHRTDISDGLEISDGRELAFTTPRSRTRDWGERMMSSRCDRGAQDELSYLRARVNALFRDRPYHRHTTMILDREAMYARIAWTSSEDRSAAIEAHDKLTQHLEPSRSLEARDLEPQDGPAENVMLTGAGMSDKHDSDLGGRRQVSNVRECTYTDFLKC
ncbi:hypothetical protein Tco_0761708 [Tanacetum coccineum]